MVTQSSSRARRVLEDDTVRFSTILRYFCSTCQHPLLFQGKNYTTHTPGTLESQPVAA
jgi:hypothetical protein